MQRMAANGWRTTGGIWPLREESTVAVTTFQSKPDLQGFTSHVKPTPKPPRHPRQALQLSPERPGRIRASRTSMPVAYGDSWTRNDDAFWKAQGLHKGENSSCHFHLHQHYELYMERQPEAYLPNIEQFHIAFGEPWRKRGWKTRKQALEQLLDFKGSARVYESRYPSRHYQTDCNGQSSKFKLVCWTIELICTCDLTCSPSCQWDQNRPVPTFQVHRTWRCTFITNLWNTWRRWKNRL